MFFGFVAGLAGMAKTGMADFIALPAYAVLDAQLRAIEFFSRFPFAKMEFSSPTLRAMLAISAGIFAVWFTRRSLARLRGTNV